MPRDLDAPYDFVDPGVHFSAVASYHHRELYRAEYRPARNHLDFSDTITICEKPRVRSEYEQKRDGRRIKSADIEDLLIACGEMCGCRRNRQYVSVASWKGTADKDTMHDRLLARGDFKGRVPLLSPDELRILAAGLDGVAKSLHHNVYDAVCMGLKWLGRWR